MLNACISFHFTFIAIVNKSSTNCYRQQFMNIPAGDLIPPAFLVFLCVCVFVRRTIQNLFRADFKFQMLSS